MDFEFLKELNLLVVFNNRILVISCLPNADCVVSTVILPQIYQRWAMLLVQSDYLRFTKGGLCC